MMHEEKCKGEPYTESDYLRDIAKENIERMRRFKQMRERVKL